MTDLDKKNSQSRFLFELIDPRSNDPQIWNSNCSLCKHSYLASAQNPEPTSFSKCSCQNGKQTFKFEYDSRHYEIPLWVLTHKEAIFEILKSVSPDYPRDERTGYPKSLTKCTKEELTIFLEGLYQNCLYSNIDVDHWTQKRADG